MTEHTESTGHVEGTGPIESTGPGSAHREPHTSDEIRADIDEARAELAGAVDALSHKLDVKARATDKANHVAAETKQRVGAAATRAKEAAPPPVQHAVDAAVEKAGPAVRQLSEQAAPHRSKIIAAGAAAVVVFLVVRRRRAQPGASGRR